MLGVTEHCCLLPGVCLYPSCSDPNCLGTGIFRRQEESAGGATQYAWVASHFKSRKLKHHGVLGPYTLPEPLAELMRPLEESGFAIIDNYYEEPDTRMLFRNSTGVAFEKSAQYTYYFKQSLKLAGEKCCSMSQSLWQIVMFRVMVWLFVLHRHRTYIFSKILSPLFCDRASIRHEGCWPQRRGSCTSDGQHDQNVGAILRLEP